MKEAAGEANVTVITIVLIGIVAAAGAILIPRMFGNMNARSCCTEMGGTVKGWNCKGGFFDGKTLAQIKGDKNCTKITD